MKQVIIKARSILVLGLVATAWTQAGTPGEATPASEAEPAPEEIVVPAGTRVPLVMVNSVSSRHSRKGDAIYLESVFPVLLDGRIVIPSGTLVSGSVTDAKRPGRLRGKGSLQVRLEKMVLPNGVIRDLTGRPGGQSGNGPGGATGTSRSDRTKGDDAVDIVRATSTGARIGSLGGAIGRQAGTAAGAAAGAAAVVFGRRAEATLDRGTQLEMILEADLRFQESDLQSNGTGKRRRGS